MNTQEPRMLMVLVRDVDVRNFLTFETTSRRWIGDGEMADCDFYRYNVSRELYDTLHNKESIKERIEKKVHIYPPRKYSALSCCCKEQSWWVSWWNSDKRYYDSGLVKLRICPNCFTVWTYTGAGNLIVRANENTPKEALAEFKTHDEAHSQCDATTELAELAYTLLKGIFARVELMGDE